VFHVLVRPNQNRNGMKQDWNTKANLTMLLSGPLADIQIASAARRL